MTEVVYMKEKPMGQLIKSVKSHGNVCGYAQKLESFFVSEISLKSLSYLWMTAKLNSLLINQNNTKLSYS